jgi:hypothetical protein
MKLNNLINRTIFDIEFATKTDHTAFTQDLELGKERLMQLIDNELNQIDGEVNIDRLTLTFPEQGFSNYEQVREFVKKSLREEVIKNSASSASLGIAQVLKHHTTTGITPWWVDRNLGLKNSINSLNTLSDADLIEIVEKVFISRDHFLRFKNSVSQKIYKQFFERLLKGEQHVRLLSFLKKLEDQDFATTHDVLTAEYLLLKKGITQSQAYKASDIQLISNLPNNLSNQLENYTLNFEHAGFKNKFVENDFSFGQRQSQLHQDIAEVFISFLKNEHLDPSLNLTFLELQLAALNQERSNQLIKKLIYSNMFQNEKAIRRLLVFSPVFISNLLMRLMTAIHGQVISNVVSFFITQHKIFSLSGKFVHFIHLVIAQKGIKDTHEIYDLIIENFTNLKSETSFFSGFSEQAKTSVFYLEFKNQLIQKSLNPAVKKTTQVNHEAISKNLSDYINQNAYLQQILESLGYLNSAKQKALDNTKLWSPTSSQSLPQFLSGLGLGKNQMMHVSHRLWFDLSKKRTLTKCDRGLLAELRNFLLESAGNLSDREQAKTLINEVISYELSHSNRSELKDIFTAHNGLVNYIDDAILKKILSVLNPDQKLVKIYERIQDVILNSGQPNSINALRMQSILMITTRNTPYDARSYAEEILNSLLKNNPDLTRKFISTLSTNALVIEEFIAQENNEVLAALLTLSSSERSQLLEKNNVFLSGKGRVRNPLKPELDDDENIDKTKSPLNSSPLSDNELAEIWSDFKVIQNNPASKTIDLNSRVIIRDIEVLLKDKLDAKKLRRLLKLLGKLGSQKDIKKFIDFITSSLPVQDSRPEERQTETWLVNFQKKLPEIDFHSLRQDISRDENAVNQLRLWLKELLKDKKGMVLQDKSLSKKLKILLKTIEKSESRKDIKKLIDFITSPLQEYISQERQTRTWLDRFQKKMPEIDFHSLRQDISRDENAVNQLRLWLKELLKDKKGTVLQDKSFSKKLKNLLKTIEKSESRKDIKKFIDFITNPTIGSIRKESKAKPWLNELQSQVPEIDFHSLRRDISRDENAVNQLRLLLNELLKDERELLLNEQSLALSDRFEYLIQRSDTLESVQEELVVAFDPITINAIKSILEKTPSSTMDALELTQASNTILENQIAAVFAEYDLKLSELWKELLFNYAFAKSVKKETEKSLDLDQFLSKLYEKTSQKIKKNILSLNAGRKALSSIESGITRIMKEKLDKFLKEKIEFTLKGIDQLVHSEISTIKLESDSSLSAEEIHITSNDVQRVFASVEISNDQSLKFFNSLNDFIKNLTGIIEGQFLSILTKKLSTGLQPAINASEEINQIFKALQNPVLKSDVTFLVQDLKSIIPIKDINRIIDLLLELINGKKQALIIDQQALLAEKTSVFFTAGTNLNEIYSSAKATDHHKNFQDEIASLQLEKKHGATQAIRIKNYLKQLIAEKRTAILKAQNHLLTLQLEAFLKLEPRIDFSSLKANNDLNFQISKKEQANLSIKDTQELGTLTSQINQILKQEQQFIEQGLLEGIDERMKTFIHKTQTTDVNKTPLLSMEDILSTKKSLLSFINSYENNVEVITLFAKLSLKSEYKNLAQHVFDQVIGSVSKIEKAFITLNAKIGISNMSESILRQFVRVELVKSLNLPSANSQIIAFNIIEKLKSLNLLQPITEKLTSYSPKNTAEREVIAGIKLYLEEDEFNFIDRKIENEFYFNDLYFHLLANNKLPFWAKNTSYESKDAINYFNLKIINKNSDDVASWLENKNVKKTVTAHFLKQSIDSQIAFLEAVETNTTTRPLSTLFKALIPKTTDLQINLNKVFQEIINKNIYRSKNQLYILEKIMAIVSNNDADVSEVLITHFSSLNISFASNIATDLGNEVDVPTLIGYYVIDKKLPSMSLQSLQAEKTSQNFEQVLIKLSSALKRHPEEIIKVLKNEITGTSSLSNLMSLIEKRDLINSIKTEQKKLSASVQVLITSVLEELQSLDKTSVKFIAYLDAIVYLLKASGRLKRSNFNEFYRLIHLIDNRSWNKIQSSILKTQKKELEEKPTEQLDKELINIQNLVRSKSIKEIDPWKVSIEYYINYGSLPSDNPKLTLSDLSTNLQRLFKTDMLTWKVKAHHWARRKSKITHLLSLYADDEKGTLLTIIHPDLKKDLGTAIDLIHSLESHGISFNKPLDTVDGILYEIMAIWSTTFVYRTKSDPIIGSFLHRNVAVSSAKFDKLEEILDAMIKKSTGKETFILRSIKTDVIGKMSLKEKQTQQAKKDIPTDSKQGIAIYNSGLILAWPFITTLFNKIGLLDKNKFIDNHSQQKGVLLTQYLTNFSTDFEESDLALNKLLCGLEISDVVDVTLELSDYEKETAAFLLNAIIQNWEKLNKTSVKTLQETFLQREGILQRHEKDYKLHVSSKAFDLLLKTIPWNISMIQTTFMKNRILVAWKY